MVWFYIGCMFPLSHPCLRLVSIMALQAASVIALVFSILLIIASRFRYGNSNKKKPKPPHPPSWPIIGHGHLLDKNQPMHRFLSSLSQRYGPIIQLKFGLRPVLVISSSELAKECLKKNDRSFASRPSLLSGKHMGYDCKVMVSLPYGPYLRAIRKICNQHLFTPTTMESLKHVRVEEVSIWIRSLFENSHRQVNMKSRLGELLFNIMLGMIAGRKRMSRDSEEAARFKRLVEESFVLTVRFLVGDYVPFLRWVDRDIQEAMKNVFKKVDVFMTELVNDHRHRRRTQAGYTDEDLIDVLISATDNHEIPSDNNDITVKATAYGLIAPGIDTSSVTMEWALAALLRQPHILRKAQQELDAHIGQDRLVEESDLHKLKYLEAIVKETLRLYPAAPILIPRESIEACTVGGYHVPAGTMVILNAWTIHRDPAVWERPTEFDPERFLKSGKVIDVRGQNFEMIPFGSGRRICPGMSLGLCLVAYTLARLLQSFEWSLPEGTVIDMTEEVGLSMPKAVPLEVIIKPRLPLHLYY